MCAVLVVKASGVIADARGLPFDSGLRRTLAENFGMVIMWSDLVGRAGEGD